MDMYKSGIKMQRCRINEQKYKINIYIRRKKWV